MKNHRGTKTCIETRAKRDRDRKKMKDGSLLSFMRPRLTLVPSTVTAQPVLQDPLKETSSASSNQLGTRRKTHTRSTFVEELRRISTALPATISEATETDLLARFADPLRHDNPNISADCLWEEVLNPFLKGTLGWNTDIDLAVAIRRGPLGFEVVADFVAHFVEKRGVEEGLFEGKLGHLVDCAKKTMSVLILNGKGTHS